MAPNEHKRIQAEKFRIAEDPATVKREFFDLDGNKISRKLSKKMKRKNRRPNGSCTTKKQRILELCAIDLINPVVSSNLQLINRRFGKLMIHLLQGLKCAFKLCKNCCREKCYAENIDCVGHKFIIEKRRGYLKDNSIESTTFSDDFSKEEILNCT